MQKPEETSSSSSSSSSPLKHSSFNLQQALVNLHQHCSGFLHNLSTSLHHHHHFLNPNSSTPKPHFDLSIGTLIHQAQHTLQSTIDGFSSSCRRRGRNRPLWARVTAGDEPVHRFDLALSTESIEERLAGVPVYALSNSAEEFVLISGAKSEKSLGLFCFREEDAETLLKEMKSMDPAMRNGSRVVPVALNKVFQLKVDGVAFRFIPDSAEVKNALQEQQRAGISDEGFYGVPVFQSQSLILKSQNRRYRPVFFRKEDLEKSLLRASMDQKQLNPSLRGDIQVSVLEEMIKGMKESSTAKWDDVVFIPPGFDVSTALPRKENHTAAG